MTEKSLEQAHDMLSLTNLEGLYSPTYDGHRGHDWAQLFTEDGVYQTRVPDQEPALFLRGRDSLERFCDAQTWYGIHYMNIPGFEISGDTATGRIQFQYRAVAVTGQRVMIRNSSGAYDTTYAKVEGEWKIARRITSFFAESRDVFHGWYPSQPDMDEPWPYGDERYVDRRG